MLIRFVFSVGILVQWFTVQLQAADASLRFEKNVLPILTKYCLSCHGAAMQMGNLDLRTANLMMKGGSQGPALVKGSAQKSLMFRRLAEKSMPPTEKKVTSEEAEIVRAWIDTGALTVGPTDAGLHLEQNHWAFQPIVQPEVPKTNSLGWVKTPVDSFVLAQLEKKGIKTPMPADRRTLLRRVYLDLVGLLPAPDEQKTFLDDRSPIAYQKVVENLLSQPQYGECWARHWLDVVRYAESNGYERDGVKPNAWRYRDYVIDALNQDKGYDRFLTEQLAGDELENSNAETQIATTFLRLGTWDDEPAEPKLDRYDQLDDVLGTTATSLLGLTLRCARCHDHKFEPLKQTDYYSMLAIFEPLKRPQDGRADLDRLVGTAGELTAYREAMAKADAEIAPLQRQVEDVKRVVRERLFRAQNLSSPSISWLRHAEVVLAFRTESSNRSKDQKDLVEKFEKELEDQIHREEGEDEKSQLNGLEKRIATINAARPNEPPRAYVWYEDSPKAPTTHVLAMGNPANPREEVEPGIPVVLTKEPLDPPMPTRESTGRRLWLAHWMTSRTNPLVARVMVNRIWQWHFGEGLVASENDFGVMGQRPSNGELLDYLAAEFIQSGWSIKHIHRLIVGSNTYQASSAWDSQAAQVDADNVFMWRWKPRRLEAEVIRDTTLAVSGELNLEMGGASIYPAVPQAVLAGQSRPGDGWGKSDEGQAARRSIYIFVKRSLAVPELEVLDTPDTTSSCEQRIVSTTGPQALTFLNGEFIHQRAQRFAARLLKEAGGAPKAQIERAFELALCRLPHKEELITALSFLASQQQLGLRAQPRTLNANAVSERALESFCLVLLNTNEFFYLN
jgi:hypothetical protein